MLEMFYFLFFITYIYLVFALDNFIIQGLFVCINLFLTSITKTSLKKAIMNLKTLLPIILITGFFNTILGNFYNSILIIIKLIIVCNITFIYKSYLGTTKIIYTIENIFLPLKYVGISATDISLIIHIALTFIPNFIKEINEIRTSLLSKGEKIFSIVYIKYLSKLLLISVFKKTNRLELALKSKGYSE